MRSREAELQRGRAAVERVNRREKEWAIPTRVWDGIRQPEVLMDSAVRVVCALANVILQTHPVRAREHPSADGGSVP